MATPKKSRKQRTPVDPNESAEAKFKRLAEARVMRALTALRLLKNLSRLKPSEAHRKAVFGALQEALNVAESSWKHEPQTAAKFSLTIEEIQNGAK